MDREKATRRSPGTRLPIDGATESDATESLLGLPLKEGHNQVARADNGMELLVRAASGRQLDFVILDGQGQPVDQRIGVTVSDVAAGEVTCWECGVDSAGNRHCWKVPCPDIVGPWIPGKVVTQGFVLQ
jgi:hypothetical protein